MQNLSKKGLSEVVAITLIIFLSVVAVSSVYIAAIRPTILNLSPEVSCAVLVTMEPPPIIIEKACYNSQDIQLEVRRKSEIAIDRLDFSFSSGDRFYCGEICNNARIPQNPEESQIYLFDVPYQEGLTVSYSINECSISSIPIEPTC